MRRARTRRASAIQSRLPDLQEGEPLAEDRRAAGAALHPAPHAATPRPPSSGRWRRRASAAPPPTPPPSPPSLNREYVVKEGKYLRTTPLGEVVTGLMKDKFNDIVDYRLHRRHGGAAWTRWRMAKRTGRRSWAISTRTSARSWSRPRKTWTASRIKVPDEVSDEVCDMCGRQLVVKSGRFGRFLACPGWPDCTFTKPLVIEMPGKCPKCGRPHLEQKDLPEAATPITAVSTTATR